MNAQLTKLCLISTLLFAMNSVKPQGNWIQKPDVGNFTRECAVGITIAGKGYITTGLCLESNYYYMNDTWEFDPLTDTWTQKADLPAIGRTGASGFTIGSKGYVGLGFFQKYPQLSFLSDFWQFDPAMNQWTQLGDFPDGARTGASGFATQTKGYIVAGYDGTQTRSTLWEYDPLDDSWLQKANYPGNVFVSLAGFVVDENLYLGCGGKNDKNEFWRYNTTTDFWEARTPIPVGRLGAVGFSINNIGYVGTGDAGFITKQPTELSYNDFWAYIPSSDSWSEVNCINQGNGRSYAVAFSIGEKGYVGTGTDYKLGGDRTFYNDFWELDFPVGVNDLQIDHLKNDFLKVFSNPAGDRIHFEITQPVPFSSATLAVIDVTGKITIHRKITGSQFDWDTRQVSPGLYIYTLTCKGLNRSGKLVIQ